MLADAMDALPRRLILDVDPGHDPIVGRISEGERLAEPFVGWLGMARALERVLSRPEPASADPDASAER